MCLVGAVVRRYIDFLMLLILTPLVSALFCRIYIIHGINCNYIHISF